MNKTQLEQQGIMPTLTDFIYPSKEIYQEIENLSKYYQLCNQKSIKVYEKWKGKDYFKGSFGDLVRLHAMKELFELTQGKQWNHLITAIFLVQNYSSEIDLKDITKLTKEQQLEVLEIISAGNKAYEMLTEWLKPINKEDVLNAIYDAVKVTIGNDRFEQFQILKFAEIKSIPNKDKEIKIFPYILEIDNPSALVEYFKHQPNEVTESLILTFMRNKKYEFKTDVYIFLIWQNNFYSIILSEKRLNLENTAGQRAPHKYYEREFANIWLPFNIFLETDKKTKTTDILVRDQNIFKRANVTEVFKNNPEVKAWLELFLYRIIDYIQNTKQLAQGVTTTEIIKALEDKTKEIKIEERVKTDDDLSSFESRNDASSYLLKKYSSKVTSLVKQNTKLPVIIGTRNYIEGVVKYKQRTKIADILQKQNYLDWKQKHKKIYKWFEKFVTKQKVEGVVKQALQDNEYTFMAYPDWGRDEDEIKEPTLLKEKILEIKHRENITGVDRDDPRDIVWSKSEKGIWRKDDNKCTNCDKFKWQVLITLEFHDYRQICEFFNVDKTILPNEYIEHFHQQNDTYIGNPILDDVDPLDEVKDFWFREVYEKANFLKEDFKVTDRNWVSGKPELKVYITLCNICMKKFGGEIPEIIIHEWRCEYCNRHIGEWGRMWHNMKHEEKGDKIKFKDGKKIE